MKFLVMAEREMKNYKVEEPHILISISSPGANKPEIAFNIRCLKTLYLEFHDLDGLHLPSPATNYKLFTAEQARHILEMVRTYQYKVNVIICQCEAGISRSAGVAGALSKLLNSDDKEIFKKYLPNMLVYRTIIEEAIR